MLLWNYRWADVIMELQVDLFYNIITGGHIILQTYRWTDVITEKNKSTAVLT